jgi:hypothetical protein
MRIKAAETQGGETPGAIYLECARELGPELAAAAGEIERRLSYTRGRR